MADAPAGGQVAEKKPMNQEMDFIHHEPPMAYQPPSKEPDMTVDPVHERGPRMVTRLNKLGSTPADVDCPYCRKVVRTRVEEVPSDDDGMIQCLICLVCWPMLFCYESNKDLNHHCSACGRRLTHRPHGSGINQVVADMNPYAREIQSTQVESEFEQARG